MRFEKSGILVGLNNRPTFHRRNLFLRRYRGSISKSGVCVIQNFWGNFQRSWK